MHNVANQTAGEGATRQRRMGRPARREPRAEWQHAEPAVVQVLDAVSNSSRLAIAQASAVLSAHRVTHRIELGRIGTTIPKVPATLESEGMQYFVGHSDPVAPLPPGLRVDPGRRDCAFEYTGSQHGIPKGWRASTATGVLQWRELVLPSSAPLRVKARMFRRASAEAAFAYVLAVMLVEDEVEPLITLGEAVAAPPGPPPVSEHADDDKHDDSRDDAAAKKAKPA